MIGRLLALLWVWCSTSAVHAEALPMDIGSALHGESLLHHLEVFEDPTHALEIEQVVHAPFQRVTGRSLNYGFSKSAFWVRFQLRNSARERRGFMLEVAHPQLDYVTLYVPGDDGGFDVRRTGDQLPFAQRDVAYRNFLFTLEQAPGAPQTYYLRVTSDGIVELPLIVWTIEEFVAHHHVSWAYLCMFYGAMLVLGLYALSMYGFTREFATLQFSCLVLATVLFQFAYIGHLTQFVFPNAPYFAQVAVPVTMGFLLAAGSWFGKHVLRMVNDDVRLARLLNGIIVLALSLTAGSFFAPIKLSLTTYMVVDLSLFCVAMAVIVNEIRRGVREAWIVLFAYGCVFTGAAVAALKNAGVLPVSVWTQWSFQIGVAIQFLMMAIAASYRLRSLGTELEAVNDALGAKVEELEEAVVRTERATRLTEWATRVKDEFMATMSHELRTPLNTIINMPQGLVEEFVREMQAVCSHCQAVFVLDRGEQLAADAGCPVCERAGTLLTREHYRYVGDGARTMRYLERIERSGTHLLGVVNGMLEADNGEVGRVALARVWVDVAGLAREVADDMSDLAERAGVALTLDVPSAPLEHSVDPLRLRQVLINLVGNAIKFSNGQGAVRVRVAATPEGGVEFTVEDSGIGIAPDKLGTIFDSYQQAHGARGFGGTGLGLSISLSLVRAHGGELTAESELGRGSTFRFHLPRRRREQKSA